MHVRCAANDRVLGNGGAATADYVHDPIGVVSSSGHSCKI